MRGRECGSTEHQQANSCIAQLAKVLSADFYFTLSASFFAGLNFTTRLAAMVIFSPVCGFLPTCSALSATRKDPNPEMVTFSPFLIAFVMLATTLSNALRAAV